MQGTGEGGLSLGVFSGPRSLISPAVRVRKDQEKDGKSMWMMADVTGWRLALKSGFGLFFFSFLFLLCAFAPALEFWSPPCPLPFSF